MNNNEFCAHWVASNAPKNARVLDYGCGSGRTIVLLREHGIEAFGCDVYYGDSTLDANASPAAKPYIAQMAGDRIPFRDEFFDVVTSNMVLEHVADLEQVTAEIARVLKPGGVALHLFPDKGTWREGHCELPFVHWFPKGAARVYYAALLHRLGLGAHRDGRSAMTWSRDFCTWLDRWTHYRTLREIHAAFAGFDYMHIEAEWFAARFGRSVPFAGWIVRKTAGAAIVLRKPQIDSSVASTPKTLRNGAATVSDASLQVGPESRSIRCAARRDDELLPRSGGSRRELP